MLKSALCILRLSRKHLVKICLKGEEKHVFDLKWNLASVHLLIYFYKSSVEILWLCVSSVMSAVCLGMSEFRRRIG